MAARAQARQPPGEQFVHFFLGQQISDAAKDFGQRLCMIPGLLHLRQQLILIVAFYGSLIDLDRGPQPVFNQLHELDLIAQTLLQRAFRQPVALQLGMPAFLGGAIRMELANFGNPGRDFCGRGGLRGSNLFPEQFLIDEAIKSSGPLGRSEGVWVAAIGKGFERYFLLPITLQNHMAVYVCDHAVDDLPAECLRHQRHGQGEDNSTGSSGADAFKFDHFEFDHLESDHAEVHQNDCPTLNEKLKCPARWYPNCPAVSPFKLLMVMLV